MESPLLLTRREVARRELVKAIWEFFSGGDPVVIHLLAAAARDVCAPVARATGRQTFADLFDQVVVPEYRDSMRDFLRGPYNFFKHGGSNPDEQLPYFNPVLNDMLLLEACADYREAFGVCEREMAVFLSWHMITYPDVLNEHGKVWLPQISEGFSGLDAAGRMSLCRELLDAIGDGRI